MPIDGIGTMLPMRNSTPFGDAVAGNVRRLMAHHGLTQLALAKKVGVGQATLSGLLSEEPGAPKRNPRADTVDRLADYFDVPGWLLGIPEVPLDLLLGGEVQSVLTTLVNATPDGRETIVRVCAAETRYAEIHKSSITVRE